MSQIGSTYKAAEIEETLDIYFYRPLGYLIARVFQALRLRPNVATTLSILIGLIGGHLFYYRDFTLNLIGVALFIFADVLDSTDGQLARMMNIRSLYGRILDGISGNLIFINAYLHVGFRLTAEGVSPFVWFLVVGAGVCHSVQSGLADYYRNAYLRYVVNPAKGELDGLEWVRVQYAGLRWGRDFFKKIAMRLYLNYTAEQQAFSKGFQTLRKKIDETFRGQIPVWFSEEYRRLNKPLLKYYSMLAVNLRIIVLCISILIDHPTLYFWFEAIVLNAVAIALIRAQGYRSLQLVRWIETYKEP
jgi:phosphatidylglycerophosphate synthase